MLNFDTGKYAAYIWPSFGALALVCGWMVVDSLARARRWKARAEAAQALKDASKSKDTAP
ncbi:hypothetical protein BH11PSE2_BH11PSE2_08340 [soil metagenome]